MAANLEDQLIDKVRALPPNKQREALRLHDSLALDDSSEGINAEKKFRRVSGYGELWMLENALKALLKNKQSVAELASEERAA